LAIVLRHFAMDHRDCEVLRLELLGKPGHLPIQSDLDNNKK
jgi:hypothetical protein